MIKKTILGLVVTSSLVMAENATDHLLNFANMGKISGTTLEMDKTDMEDINGEWLKLSKPNSKQISIVSSYYSSLYKSNYYNNISRNV